MGKRDRHRVGRSKIVPFIPGESASDRHQRRLESALKDSCGLQVWLAAKGFELQIKNYGHHWIMTRGRHIAEWWPSSAKLVINKRWDRGSHCHDGGQVRDVLANYFRKEDGQG